MAVGVGTGKDQGQGQGRGPLLVFDVVGPMAHFRRFYTNSSSLSYPMPPRTALMGLIAALLGRERDSYYEALGMEQAHLGVALKTPVRSVMQTVNYLATDDQDWHGVKRRTQIPVEFILPRPPERFLRYRVYMQHRDEGLINGLYQQLARGEYCYPLSLGLSECLAWAEHSRLYRPEEVNRVQDPEEPLEVGTAVPLPRLAELPPVERLADRRLLKDRMPLDFDARRRLKAVVDVLWEAEGRPLPLRLRGELFRPPDEETYGCFLEL
ncbi:MAG: type I-B CRISPR-associated protein Cas5 [Candidatus Tectimicrobiota bacterium]|nr:MAG: type I-B CRISPR-associated protein Cas5 [Candidatus Tectomicrobia bacterium]